MAKKVLMIASHFPPGGGPGTKRILQFIKYLVRLGWEPHVITHNNFFHGYDAKSLDLVPETAKVHRTQSFEQLARGNTLNRAGKPGNGGNGSKPKTKTRQKANLFKAIKHFLGVIDTGILWVPFVIMRALKLQFKEGFDVIFVTGPPFSSFLSAYMVSRISGKPLVLDFRDAWVANPENRNGSKFGLLVNGFLEGAIVKRSKFAIANTDGVLEDFISRYPLAFRNKFTVITNGYDREDLQFNVPGKPMLDRSKFNIVHTGTLRNFRSPRNLLMAIKELCNEGNVDKKSIKVHFVGLLGKFNDGCTLRDYIEDFNLSDVVEQVGFVSRNDAFRYNFEADVLLLIIGIIPREKLQTYGLSGKVYDYMLAQKPILSLAQNGGATYRLLVKHKVGVLADPTDEQDIKNKILEMYHMWQKGKLKEFYRSDLIDQFDMAQLSLRLNNVLDAAFMQPRRS